MSRMGAGFALVLAATGCAADRPTEQRGPAPEARVSVGAVAATELPAGLSATVIVPVTIADGYHVQANPAARPFLVPLELTIAAAADLEVGAPGYPPGRAHRLAGSDEDLATYEGTIRITLPITARGDLAPGERTLEGGLRYQACDERRCYAPATVPIAIPIAVTAPRPGA